MTIELIEQTTTEETQSSGLLLVVDEIREARNRDSRGDGGSSGKSDLND